MLSITLKWLLSDCSGIGKCKLVHISWAFVNGLHNRKKPEVIHDMGFTKMTYVSAFVDKNTTILKLYLKQNM
jgi:hypothetical protein